MTQTEIPWGNTDALPDREEQLAVAKDLIAGERPLMPEAPDCTFTLPRGLSSSGLWHRDVELRELTGEDEEVLAKVKDPLDFFTRVVALGVVRIGDVELASRPVAEREHFLDQLLTGEKDQLYLQVARLTYGNEKKIGFKCERCGVQQETTLLLDEDFKPKEVEHVEDTFFIHTTGPYKEAPEGYQLQVRPATGADLEKSLEHRGANFAESNTILLSRCIMRANDQMLPDPMGFARGLKMKDRLELVNQLRERQPGIDLLITTTCVSCGGDQALPLTWGDIFRL